MMKKDVFHFFSNLIFVGAVCDVVPVFCLLNCWGKKALLANRACHCDIEHKCTNGLKWCFRTGRSQANVFLNCKRLKMKEARKTEPLVSLMEMLSALKCHKTYTLMVRDAHRWQNINSKKDRGRELLAIWVNRSLGCLWSRNSLDFL